MKRFLLLVLALTVLASPAWGGGLLIGSGIVSSGCTETTGTAYSTNNNATDLDGTETDATTGWTNSGAIMDSVDTAPYSGSYNLSITADSANDRVYRTFTLDFSKLYKTSFYSRHSGTGGAWLCAFGHNNNDRFVGNKSILSTDTTYTESVFYHSGAIDNLGCIEYNGTDDGTIYIDSFSMKEVTPCLGQNLITGDAASDDSNSIGSFVGLTADVTVNNTDSIVGTKSIQITATGSNGRAYIDLNSVGVTGKTYLLEFYAKGIAGDLNMYAGVDSDTTYPLTQYVIISYSSWTYYAFSFNYSSNTRYILIHENGSNNNASFLIDGLAIKEIE